MSFLLPVSPMSIDNPEWGLTMAKLFPSPSGVGTTTQSWPSSVSELAANVMGALFSVLPELVRANPVLLLTM